MNAGHDIGLIGSETLIRAVGTLMPSTDRLLPLGDMAQALRALPAAACDILLVHATDPGLAAYARLAEIAPPTPWIALDDDDDVTRGRRWIEAGASAWLPLPTLDAAALRRAIAQTLALRVNVDAMRLQRDDLQAVFDFAPLPMWVYDSVSLRFLAVNDAALRAYGWTREEFLRLNLYDIRPATEHIRLSEALSRPLPALAEAEIWRHRDAAGLIDSSTPSKSWVQIRPRLCSNRSRKRRSLASMRPMAWRSTVTSRAMTRRAGRPA